jgi:hypothetical protein
MSRATAILTLLRDALRDRRRLLLENAALRHQVAVLKRSVTRPRIEDSERIFWIAMRRMLREWKECLILVKPETVVRWHRRGFRYYWARRSRRRTQGRPPIGWKLVHLIKCQGSAIRSHPQFGQTEPPGSGWKTARQRPERHGGDRLEKPGVQFGQAEPLFAPGRRGPGRRLRLP